MDKGRLFMRCLGLFSLLLFSSLLSAQAIGGEVAGVDQRFEQERANEENTFSILPHKPNYLLFASYNSRPNQTPWQGFGYGAKPVQKTEMNFQVSIKVPVAHDLFRSDDGLYLAYTQKSFWQSYNKQISSPFRETNYNPEMFYRMRFKAVDDGLSLRAVTLGIEHESNGRAEPLSRSWNRIYGVVTAASGDLTLAMKVWWRIPESANNDNNPDILNYLGNGELYGYYKHGGHTFGAMFRPAWRGGFNSAVRVDWSFPLYGKLKGYVQFFNGYGESLIDYNHYNNTIGVGVMLTNWL